MDLRRDVRNICTYPIVFFPSSFFVCSFALGLTENRGKNVPQRDVNCRTCGWVGLVFTHTRRAGGRAGERFWEAHHGVDCELSLLISTISIFFFSQFNNIFLFCILLSWCAFLNYTYIGIYFCRKKPCSILIVISIWIFPFVWWLLCMLCCGSGRYETIV